MASYNALLCYPNIDTRATLSMGSWTATMPLNNLKTRVIKEYARTTNTLASSTRFLATFDKARPMRVVNLTDHNLTTSASYRVRLFDDAALTMLAYDSGEVRTFGQIYDETTVPGGWDGGNLFDLTTTEEEREGLTAAIVHVMPTTVAAQYLLVELFDTTNPAGYVQAGRLFVGDAWEPIYNMSYGAGLSYENRDEIDEADSGSEYFNTRPSPRVARFTLGFMTEDEAMTRAFDMQRTQGATQDVLFVWNQSDVAHAARRSFLGRLRSLQPIEQDFFDNFRSTHEIKELL